MKYKLFKKISLKLHADRTKNMNKKVINRKTGSLRSYYGAEKKKDKASQELDLDYWTFTQALVSL